MTRTFDTVTAQDLKKMLHDGDELALIDVREQAVFFAGHLLFACCIPLSRLELTFADLVPRRATRIVLCDGGDMQRSTTAADKLATFGYSDVRLLENGVEGWKQAGFELFSGINVPSKAFGEYVEILYDTPHISAQELHAKIAAGEKLVVLDSRPREEFHNMSIPGGIDCPGAELAYRVHDVAPDPDTQVVVNCAGRTRSIIGAQSLINAGIPNPVMALENGTMGWKLAGFELAHGHSEHAPKPSAAGLAKAQTAAEQVAQRFGVRKVDMDTVDRWRSEAGQRTVYLLDVRSPEEFALAHLAGSRNAPGGQLVQATDEYVATRNARLVLIDDTEVRATMTASWLIQMGWEHVYVLVDGLGDATLAPGPNRRSVLGLRKQPTLTAAELKNRLDAAEASTLVVDFSTSLKYRRQHVPGAWWGLRTELDTVLASLPPHETLVLTSEDGLLAHLAAADIAAAGHPAGLLVLENGNQGWLGAGFDSESGNERFACEPNDVWYKPYEKGGSVEQAMRDYLTWEVNLVEQIKRDGDARFR
jgi:rhodanese-related sulfurtransferase